MQNFPFMFSRLSVTIHTIIYKACVVICFKIDDSDTNIQSYTPTFVTRVLILHTNLNTKLSYGSSSLHWASTPLNVTVKDVKYLYKAHHRRASVKTLCRFPVAPNAPSYQRSQAVQSSTFIHQRCLWMAIWDLRADAEPLPETVPETERISHGWHNMGDLNRVHEWFYTLWIRFIVFVKNFKRNIYLTPFDGTFYGHMQHPFWTMRDRP